MKTVLIGQISKPEIWSALFVDPVVELPNVTVLQQGAIAGHGFLIAPEVGGDDIQGRAVELSSRDAERLSYFVQAIGGNLSKTLLDGQEFQMPIAPAGDTGVANTAVLGLAVFEIMQGFPSLDPDQIAQQIRMILVRADAKQNAVQNPAPAGSLKATLNDIAITRRDLKYRNFFAMEEFEMRHPGFSGQDIVVDTRAVFLASDAAIVLPYDAKRDRVLLIEQLRMGPIARHDLNPWMMEPVAGRVDFGETGETTAMREAEEEAGLTLTRLEHVHSGYVSPGCSTEYFHTYVGLCELPDNAALIAGLDSEQEDILGHVLEWDDFYDRLLQGQLPVVPLALAGYWLAAQRARLRSA